MRWDPLDRKAMEVFELEAVNVRDEDTTEEIGKQALADQQLKDGIRRTLLRMDGRLMRMQGTMGDIRLNLRRGR